jgi:formyl-CoA transferase
LCKALGREDLANNPRFRTNPDKVASRVVLVRILQKIFATNSRKYWLKLLKEYSVPAATVYEINEVFEDRLSLDAHSHRFMFNCCI